MIAYEQFDAVEMRVGTVLEAEAFSEARIPAYILRIDFGPDIGVKRSSARITDLYSPDNLVGKQIIGVTNFPPKMIGPIISEVLVLGVPVGTGPQVSLLSVGHPAENGARVF